MDHGVLEKSHASQIRDLLEEGLMPLNFWDQVLSKIGHGKEPSGKPRYPEVADIERAMKQSQEIESKDIESKDIDAKDIDAKGIPIPESVRESRIGFITRFLLGKKEKPTQPAKLIKKINSLY